LGVLENVVGEVVAVHSGEQMVLPKIVGVIAVTTRVSNTFVDVKWEIGGRAAQKAVKRVVCIDGIS
jgi:hypothetical protein